MGLPSGGFVTRQTEAPFLFMLFMDELRSGRQVRIERQAQPRG